MTEPKTAVTCLSLDCPERTGGKCNALEELEPMTDISKKENAWEKYYKVWASQGRTDEQQWAVKNFMTGQGFVMFKKAIAESNTAVIEEIHRWAKETNMCGDLVATSDLMSYLEELKRQQGGEK